MFVEEHVQRAFRTVMERDYRHLANPKAMQVHMGLAIEDKKQMFKNVVREENMVLYEKLKSYLGGIAMVLDKVALVLEAKYGLNMLPTAMRKRKSQELVEAHVENMTQQPTSPNAPMPDMQRAADSGHMGQAMDQLCRNPMGREMLQGATLERRERSVMDIDGPSYPQQHMSHYG